MFPLWLKAPRALLSIALTYTKKYFHMRTVEGMQNMV
jgi:hypothetical protein